MKKLKIGIIGIGGRGWGLLKTICGCKQVEVTAICEIYPDRLKKAIDFVRENGNCESTGYSEYKDMIQNSGIEAVVITTPWDSHVRISVDCMRAGIAVGCEVSGAYDIEDCWQLVRTYEETGTPYMMLENCCYDRFELLTTAMARAGKFGRILYCHGSYAHELRNPIINGRELRHYRTEEYIAQNCDNYPTHDLGPIAKLLGINRGNKLVSLTSMATKPGVSLKKCVSDGYNHDESLKDTEFNIGDIIVTTIKCANGEVITLKLDTTLPRFYDREFTIRGTKGMASQTQNMVLIEGYHNMEEFWEPEKTVQKYLNSANEYDKYLVDFWKDITPEQREMGHGGMDFFVLNAFFNAVINKDEMPIDVYDAATWMAISPLSAQSVAHGGMPQAIPDFTRGQYIRRPLKDVVDLPNPEDNEEPKYKVNLGNYRRDI